VDGLEGVSLSLNDVGATIEDACCCINCSRSLRGFFFIVKTILLHLAGLALGEIPASPTNWGSRHKAVKSMFINILKFLSLLEYILFQHVWC